ncbi:MAG: FtsX-like permease family protein [Christensenellaceae bacterium]
MDSCIPRALVQEDAFSGQASIQCMIYFQNGYYKWVKDPMLEGTIQTYANQQTVAFMRVIENSGIQYISNYNYYGINLPIRIAPLVRYKTLFTVVLFIGAGLAVTVSLFMYINRYRDAYYRMYTLGAEGEFPFYTYLIQILMLLLLAIPLGLLLFLLATLGIRLLFGHSIILQFSFSNLWLPAIFLLFSFLVALILFITSIRPLRNANTSKEKSAHQNKPMRLKKSFIQTITVSFLRINLRKVTAMLLLIGLLCATLALSIDQSKENRRSYIQAMDENAGSIPQGADVDFSLQVLWSYGGGLEGISGFDLPVATPSVMQPLIPVEEIAPLRVLSGVEMLYEYVNTPAQAVIEVEEGYEGYWSEMLGDTTEEDLAIQEKIAQQEALLYGTPTMTDYPEHTAGRNVRVVVANATALAYYEKEFPGMIPKDGIQKNEALLVLPKTKTSKNDLLEVGDSLRMGMMTYPQGQYEKAMRKDRSLLTYKEEVFEIIQILEPERSFTDDIVLHDTLLLFVSEEAAATCPLFFGIENIGIKMAKTATPEEAYAAKDALLSLSAGYPNPRVEEKEAQMAYYGWVLETVDIANTLFIIVFGGFICISIYTVLHLSLGRRKRSLGIFRALGMRRRTITSELFLEIMIYWILAMLFALLLLYPLFQILWYDVLILLHTFTRAIPLLIYPLLAGIPISYVLSILLSRAVYADSVSSAIRFAE